MSDGDIWVISMLVGAIVIVSIAWRLTDGDFSK